MSLESPVDWFARKFTYQWARRHGVSEQQLSAFLVIAFAVRELGELRLEHVRDRADATGNRAVSRACERVLTGRWMKRSIEALWSQPMSPRLQESIDDCKAQLARLTPPVKNASAKTLYEAEIIQRFGDERHYWTFRVSLVEPFRVPVAHSGGNQYESASAARDAAFALCQKLERERATSKVIQFHIGTDT